MYLAAKLEQAIGSCPTATPISFMYYHRNVHKTLPKRLIYLIIRQDQELRERRLSLGRHDHFFKSYYVNPQAGNTRYCLSYRLFRRRQRICRLCCNSRRERVHIRTQFFCATVCSVDPSNMSSLCRLGRVASKEMLDCVVRIDEPDELLYPVDVEDAGSHVIGTDFGVCISEA